MLVQIEKKHRLTVSIPQRQFASVAVGGGTKDGAPLRGATVNSTTCSISRARILQFFVPSLVGRSAPEPILAALNVEPHTAGPSRFAIRVQVAHQLAHLSRGGLRAGGTGEHVNIACFDTSGYSIVQRGAHTRINRARGAVSAGNDKVTVTVG